MPSFDAPGGLPEDEATAIWGRRGDPTLRDPRALQKQVSSRPTFVAQTRRDPTVHVGIDRGITAPHPPRDRGPACGTNDRIPRH